jgi:hypothetical protein
VLKMKKAPVGEPWLRRRFGCLVGWVSAGDGGACGSRRCAVRNPPAEFAAR